HPSRRRRRDLSTSMVRNTNFTHCSSPKTMFLRTSSLKKLEAARLDPRALQAMINRVNLAPKGRVPTLDCPPQHGPRRMLTCTMNHPRDLPLALDLHLALVLSPKRQQTNHLFHPGRLHLSRGLAVTPGSRISIASFLPTTRMKFQNKRQSKRKLVRAN